MTPPLKYDMTVNEWFALSRRDQRRWVMSATDTEKMCLMILGFKIDQASVRAVTSTIGALSSAASAIGVPTSLGGIAHLIESTAEAGNHLFTLSKSLGLSASELQNWGALARVSGSNVNEFAVGVGMFERSLRSLSQGSQSKQLIANFAEVGISASEAKRILTSPGGLDQALLMISDRFQKMGDTAERASLGSRLFGARAGRAMVGDLSRGSEAIKEMREHLQAIGGTVSENSINRLRNLNVQIVEMKLAWQGVIMESVAAIGPTLIELVQSATSWIGQHTEDIRGFFQGMSEGVQDGLSAIRAIMSPVVWLVGQFAEHATIAKVAGYALGAALTFAAVRFAVFWVAALGPIGIAIAAIGTFAAIVIKYWDDIVDGVMAVGRAIRDAFSAAFDFIRNLPVIKQLFDLVDKLAQFIGKNASHDEAQKKIDAFAETDDSPWYAKIAARGNDFLSDHPILAAATGGGGEMARRDMEDRVAAMPSTTAPTHVEQKIDIHVSGVSGDDVGRQIGEHLDSLFRDASAAANGGH